jgi:hypothetical protein
VEIFWIISPVEFVISHKIPLEYFGIRSITFTDTAFAEK